MKNYSSSFLTLILFLTLTLSLSALPTHSVLEDCDMITMADGEVIKARVLELNQTEIRFQLCNNSKDIITVDRTSVSKVVFSASTNDKAEAASIQKQKSNKEDNIKKAGMAGGVLILIILALLAGVAVGIGYLIWQIINFDF